MFSYICIGKLTVKSFDPTKGKVGLIKTKSKKFHTCKCVLLSKSFVCQVCCIGVLYNLDSSTRSFKLCLFPAAPCPPRSVWAHVSLYAAVFLSFFLLMPMACSQLMALKEYWTTEPDKHKNQCCCQDLSLYLHIWKWLLLVSYYVLNTM